MPNYLDKDGLLYFWQKIKYIFVTDQNYVHTDNNFTTSLKNKLDGIASGAEVNVQPDWDVTDTTSDAFIKNKPNIPAGVVVDTAMSGSSENAVQNKVIYNFVNTSIASAVSGLYKYKGSVATASLLPSSGQTIGDVYNIESSSSYGGPGMNVAWDGTDWDPLGEIFTITSVTNAEIDTIVAS